MDQKKLAETRLAIDPEFCEGKPRIKGSRVTIAEILLHLLEGKDTTEILRVCRTITKDDIQAALAYSYCIAEGIPVTLKTSTGEDYRTYIKDPEKEREMKEKAVEELYQSLEELAPYQEELTQRTIEKVKAAKKAKAQGEGKAIAASQGDAKIKTPEKRPYDLIIELGPQEKTKIFTLADHHEQGLEMDHDNYIFRWRDGDPQWLTYSTSKQGIEIDKQMRRNLKVRFTDEHGKRAESIFEGYLSSNRKNKIFIERKDDKTCGRAL